MNTSRPSSTSSGQLREGSGASVTRSSSTVVIQWSKDVNVSFIMFEFLSTFGEI